MADFAYQEMFPLGEDTTEYRLLTKDHVSVKPFEGQDILKIEAQGLTLLTEQAFRDIAFMLRPSHLKLLAAIFDDPESSDNDRYVALEMLKNAVIAAEGIFPMCQDTGTAIVMGKKGSRSGPVSVTKRPFPEACSRLIPEIICAIPRTRL